MGRYVRVWEVGGEEGFMGVEGVASGVDGGGPCEECHVGSLKDVVNVHVVST